MGENRDSIAKSRGILSIIHNSESIKALLSKGESIHPQLNFDGN